MHIGFSASLQDPPDGRSDAEVYHQVLGFALQAEMWGFHSVWVGEGHFGAGGLCPDPLQLLAYLAGQTRRIHLATWVVALPGQDPVRLAEKVALLDNLSVGRVVLGIGRGGDALDPADQRFAEQARMLLGALEAGHPSGDGAPGPELRPRLQRSFAGRIFGTASAPDDLAALVELNAGLLVTTGPYEHLGGYREAWAAAREDPVPGPVCTGPVLVDEDGPRAQELADEYGLGAGAVAGTPAQVIEQLAAVRDDTGIAAFVVRLCFAAMGNDEAERNVACFVDQVMPALEAWETSPLVREPGRTGGR